ncbi:ComEC/Rec2 family competence protein [Methanosarcina barkeri]|uniref:Late competence protein ComEC, DNA transport n=1 Tax=Methanosarcina barkeri 227 TaxID=1434106 RepID=A0A0E3R0P7_METBA|nr:MBL fold metallo-hydrolase [Methanosarcina barkeri]AKB56850.1 Late competence protein ComEC, DNA transport [Methanosarcina barkeri 227]
MSEELKIWFLDVGHGDCSYIELPNGARMMIDCGSGDDHWPSKFLNNYHKINKSNPVPASNNFLNCGLDRLVITHPHGDHIGDIEAIYKEIGFYLFTGGYSSFIDRITSDQIDFRKRGQNATKEFMEIVKRYNGTYDLNTDRIVADPLCRVEMKRFIEYEDGMDLNELSFFVSIKIGRHKVLFTGDMTAVGVRKILDSNQKSSFKEFVKGTTILKIPHHGRDNGCSQEMFEAFESKPLLCIVSDEILNERNEGTSNTNWYIYRASDKEVNINGVMQSRKVLTTRKDKDILLKISDTGSVSVITNYFKDVKPKILQN